VNQPHNKTYVSPKVGSHRLYQCDSLRVSYSRSFDLVITSPPFFHPSACSQAHGSPAPTHDLDEYAEWVGRALSRAHRDPSDQFLCFIKTDVRYKSTILPVGFRILDACLQLGMTLRAHWVWERTTSFSPYAPSISNIFVFGSNDRRKLQHGGVFKTDDLKHRSYRSSFTPELFRQLIVQLSVEGQSVLDPFAGIGSCILAASRSNRWSVGVEIDGSQIRKGVNQLTAAGVSALEYHLE
jgi:DNA modification methylase